MTAMTADAQARVTRLVRWIKKHKPGLLGPDGEVAPAKLADKLGDSVSYWSDVLRLKKNSFASAKARKVEEGLGMRAFYLDGAGWPFEGVDEAEFERLTERQKGEIEHALKIALHELTAGASPSSKQAVPH